MIKKPRCVKQEEEVSVHGFGQRRMYPMNATQRNCADSVSLTTGNICMHTELTYEDLIILRPISASQFHTVEDGEDVSL